MTKIKICGLRRECDTEYANLLLPEYIGFVFAEKSPRCVTPSAAARLRERIDARITAVGVFVDAPVDAVAALLADGVIDAAQLHGGEDARYIARLRELCDAEIIKALPAGADRREYEGADYWLFDSFRAGASGGSGERFNWSELGAVTKPFFLAGGLTPENAAAAIASVSPYCLDVSSGVETEGYKDYEKMKRFVEAVRTPTKASH
ncbi:MAG: phosphoribosylanthranilate isomerase [Oscillospiraceae bacterium]|nr:phosphoribosylanthranilate isomerase [Oscillospiraceae bacterium]